MTQRWLTFDCYGTMIDWRTGMTDALEGVSPGRSADLIEGYHRFEPEVEAQLPFRNYRAVLTEGLQRAVKSIDAPVAESDYGVLADTLPLWPAFPDSAQALQELRGDGYKLAILSNTDIDMIRGTLAGPLPVEFDDVITAEHVQSYKPGDGMFDEFLKRHNPASTDWIHVGNSVWHDCEPAHKRGSRSVFVHRAATAPERGCATLVMRSLSELPSALRKLS